MKTKIKTKAKTKKTLSKRIRITSTGKIVAKQSSTGHLKRKMTSSRKHRKNRDIVMGVSGFSKNLKKMMN